MRRKLFQTVFWASAMVMLLAPLFVATPTKVKAASAGSEVTYTGVLQTASAPYDHQLSGLSIHLFIGSGFDGWLGQTVSVKVHYSDANHFTVESVTLVSTPAPVTTTTTNGTTKTFTGTLIVDPNTAYQFQLAGMNVHLILGSSFSSWVGHTVHVNVVYTTSTHFVVQSVTLV